jgi:acyl-CoA reductase-like NAD-dependent aldehyde dehydrogenase
LFGRQIPVPGGVDITFREAIGVVGIIVPWNFPMPIAGWGFAPALAAGCTVVLKPAEVTPLTAMKLAELGLEAGLPENVFQVLTGSGRIVGETIVQDPRVRKIVFTGSTEIGTQIMAKCAPNVKRVTLELGGKSANVIFADSDLEKAAASAPGAVFDNAGQDCCARSRILIEKKAFDKFMPLLEQSVKAFKCADPNLDTTEMGPLITSAHRDKVASYVEESLVAFRGTAPTGAGFWFPPTVMHITDRKHKSLSEEIFGPIVSVVTFEDEADAIGLANDSEFGLSGSIWTNNGAKALRVARGIESGNLSVNSHSSVRYWTPFGGFKKSGLGRELGPDALNAFTEEKNVFINTEI